MLQLLATCEEEMEFLVLGFAEAFWLMLLAESERKWFVSQIRNTYFVFLRNAMCKDWNIRYAKSSSHLFKKYE